MKALKHLAHQIGRHTLTTRVEMESFPSSRGVTLKNIYIYIFVAEAQTLFPVSLSCRFAWNKSVDGCVERSIHDVSV